MIRSALLLLALTFVAAVATHAWHPKAPAWYLTSEPLKDDEVDMKMIQERWQGEVLWIDARLREHFEKLMFRGRCCSMIRSAMPCSPSTSRSFRTMPSLWSFIAMATPARRAGRCALT